MSLLLVSDQATAQSFCDRAQAWLVANVARYEAAKWADPKQHPTKGTWAMPFENRLAPAFTSAELGTHTSQDDSGATVTTWQNVVAVTPDWDPPSLK